MIITPLKPHSSKENLRSPEPCMKMSLDEQKNDKTGKKYGPISRNNQYPKIIHITKSILPRKRYVN